MTRQTDQLKRATDTLAQVTAYDLASALRRIDDWMPGISGSGDGPGPKNSVSDPVGNMAGQPDPASDALKRINAALRQLVTNAEILYAEVAAAQPRHPNSKDIAATKYANDPLCEWCTRWSNGNGDLVLSRTDLGGALSEVTGLCRWCADFGRAQGRLPSESECTRHHRGQQIRVSA